MIYGKEDSSELFARGHYTEGTKYIDFIMERILSEVEKCDSLDAIIFNHSIGGGTGSGLTSLILSRLDQGICSYGSTI